MRTLKTTKNLSTFILSTLSLALVGLAGFTTTAQADGGDWGPGSGGDMCVERIKEIRDDIGMWIERGGSENLDFSEMAEPSGEVSKLEFYNEEMTAALLDAEIECVDETLFINETTLSPVSRTCLNQFEQVTGRKRIRCNREEFESLLEQRFGEERQYQLVHHEFAGLAGIENNELHSNGVVNEDSSFLLSRQLSAFLETVTIKRLAVNRIENVQPELIEGNSGAYPGDTNKRADGDVYLHLSTPGVRAAIRLHSEQLLQEKIDRMNKGRSSRDWQFEFDPDDVEVTFVRQERRGSSGYWVPWVDASIFRVFMRVYVVNFNGGKVGQPVTLTTEIRYNLGTGDYAIHPEVTEMKSRF